MWWRALFFLFLSSHLQSQIITADTIQGVYNSDKKSGFIFIASAFGSDQVSKSTALDSVSGFLITEIVLVYSYYRKSETFNQSRLNEARWKNLQLTYPSLFQSAVTKYRNVCQEIPGDTASKKLNHGFYIYFENPADPAKREKEVAEISSMLLELGIDTAASAGAPAPETSAPDSLITFTAKKSKKFSGPLKTKDPLACRQPFYGKGLEDLDAFFRKRIVLSPKQKRNPKELFIEVRLKLDNNGFIKNAYLLSVSKTLSEQVRKALYEMEPWNPAVRSGNIIKSDVKFDLQYSADGTMRLKGGITVPSYLSKCGTAPDEELFDLSVTDKKVKRVASLFQVEDNTIFKSFIEKDPGADSLLLVVDLTGSMGPYIAQVIEVMTDILAKGRPHVSCVSLFNDGDGKKDKNKNVGNTGGIIVLEKDITIENLGNAILQSMKRGSGGDCMENNLEAVLRGLEKCRDCRNVVMVADNAATPRDGALINNIKQPMHWLLCGAYEGINTNYLDLIRLNQGILYAGESKVNDLHLVKEGAVIAIGNFNYRLEGGKFKFQRMPR